MEQSPETRSLSPERVRPRALELAAAREKGFVGEALLTATGVALVGYGMLRRNPRGTLLMAAGTLIGAIGARRLRGRTAMHPSGTSRSVTVLASRGEAYRVWRDFSNLPRFMQHIDRVEDLGGGRHRWRLRLGRNLPPIEWETQIVDEREGELVAWRSADDGAVETQGRIELVDAPGSRGTEVHATITYSVRPGRAIGTAAGRMLEPLVAHEVKEDLRRFKQLVETGAIARTTGQSSGRGRQEPKTSETTPPRKSAMEVRP